MMGQVLGNLTNIVLDPVFMNLTLGWNISGAARLLVRVMAVGFFMP